MFRNTEMDIVIVLKFMHKHLFLSHAINDALKKGNQGTL